MDFLNKAKESLGSGQTNTNTQGGAAPAAGQQPAAGGASGQEDYGDKGMLAPFLPL